MRTKIFVLFIVLFSFFHFFWKVSWSIVDPISSYSWSFLEVYGENIYWWIVKHDWSNIHKLDLKWFRVGSSSGTFDLSFYPLDLYGQLNRSELLFKKENIPLNIFKNWIIKEFSVNKNSPHIEYISPSDQTLRYSFYNHINSSTETSMVKILVDGKEIYGTSANSLYPEYKEHIFTVKEWSKIQFMTIRRLHNDPININNIKLIWVPISNSVSIDFSPLKIIPNQRYWFLIENSDWNNSNKIVLLWRNKVIYSSQNRTDLTWNTEKTKHTVFDTYGITWNISLKIYWELYRHYNNHPTLILKQNNKILWSIWGYNYLDSYSWQSVNFTASWINLDSWPLHIIHQNLDMWNGYSSIKNIKLHIENWEKNLLESSTGINWIVSSIWWLYNKLYHLPNYIPTIRSITSTQNYINNSNSWSFDISINWVTDTSSWQTLTYKYSTDNVNYSSLWTSISPLTNHTFTWSIDLSSLSQWDHNIYVKINDWLIDSSVSILNVHKDTIKPTLSQIQAITTPTNQSSPVYKFNSTETWSITYSGSCSSVTSSAVLGSNTITLNSLSDWTYNNCSFTVTDLAWNISSSLDIPEFKIDTTPPLLPNSILYNSWSTYSTTRAIDIQITHPDESDVYEWCVLESTLRGSSCVRNTTKPNSYTFSSDWNKKLKIYLRDNVWNDNTYSPTNEILIDTIDPVLSITQNIDDSYTNTWKILKVTATDDNLLRFWYNLVETSETCDWSITYPTIYSSWSWILLDNELYNNKKLCFNAYDKAWRNSYISSPVIKNIDTTNPSEPIISSAHQSAWNKIKFKWTCSYENWLKFIVKDNWTEIGREILTDPCSIDFEYTLSWSVNHNIEYYLEDIATNKSLTKSFVAYVDSSWILVTPGDWKTVEPLITFFWYAQPNTNVKIKKTSSWSTYIASWSTDNNWIFTIQTATSQPLWNLSIDLEVWWTPKNNIRNITVSSNSIIVPEIDESSVYSKYSWVKDIYSFESQTISFKAKWEPLSTFAVYSYAEVLWNRVMTEIYEWKFDSSGNANVNSNVSLPGWENELVILDTIHNVSSNIVHMVIADPFGIVYDSSTKQPLIWAKITFCEKWQTSPAILPFLHWEAQPNPVTTNSDWRYFSYETVWKKYYICWVEMSWYTFPSKIISSGTNNLDWTSNLWSHGQVFEIIPTPLHIDIPLDRIISTSSSSSWWGWSWYSYISSSSTKENYYTIWNRQLKIWIQKWTKTKDKIYSNDFSWGVYSWNIYRALYENWKNWTHKRWISITKPLFIQITDLDLNEYKIYIKYSENEDYQLFNDYTIFDKNTISFESNKGFELFIDNNLEIVEDLEKYEDSEISEILPEKYEVDFYKIGDVKSYILYINKFDKKYWKIISNIPEDKINIVFPKVLERIKNIESDKLSNKYKYIYNYLWWIYNLRY